MFINTMRMVMQIEYRKQDMHNTDRKFFPEKVEQQTRSEGRVWKAATVFGLVQISD